MKEGVIQYQLEFSKQPLPADIDNQALGACRARLFAKSLIGQDPKRYGGLGYGNISQRLPKSGKPHAFLITGSQTGHLSALKHQHYAWVTACDPFQNRLQAFGETAPSSEAMTHAMIYQTLPWVQGVIHVHWPKLWQNALSAGLAVTPAHVPYGTPHMAAAVQQVLLATHTFPTGSLAMLGHEDGIVVWGETLDAAEHCLMQYTEY